MGKTRRSKHITEDLDLDVHVPQDEERIVHNKRADVLRKGIDEILPSEAHKANEDDDQGAEAEELALMNIKKTRNRLRDSDFTDMPHIPKQEKQLIVAPTIEAVNRDFSDLSASERMSIVRRESPEVIKMMEEFKAHMEAVESLATPLQQLVSMKCTQDEKQLLSFLECKVQLLLSYCMHTLFYLLLKTEGKPIEGHPVLDRLVELRVYLEKMWPLEQKLQYSLNKLLNATMESSSTHKKLRSVENETHDGIFKQVKGLSKSSSRHKAEKRAREEEQLQQEEEETMTRFQRKTKKTKATEIAVDGGYQEEEDQYFSKLVGDDDGVSPASGSLLDRIRARKQLDKAENDGYDELSDDEEPADEEGEDDYEQLVAEENLRRDEEAQDEDEEEQEVKTRPELSRREIGNNIKSHRGLTKARPKDRKTPRTNQRRKYERGVQKAQAQNRSTKVRSDGGANLRPNVTHSVKFA